MLRKTAEIFSDCGTNYIRTKSYLKASPEEVVGSYLTNESTMNFLPSVPPPPFWRSLGGKSQINEVKLSLKLTDPFKEKFCTILE